MIDRHQPPFQSSPLDEGAAIDAAPSSFLLERLPFEQLGERSNIAEVNATVAVDVSV